MRGAGGWGVAATGGVARRGALDGGAAGTGETVIEGGAGACGTATGA